MEIKKVGVLGCGLMGSGIAQVSATAGFDVVVLEAEQKFLDKGFAGIEKSLAKLAEKGTLKETPDAVRARLKGTVKKEDLAGCDLVIEAIIENVEEKRKMYSALDAIVKKDAIFASNTSSISITELMTATQRPERFVGLHFFNPVPLMKLVEVVRTVATADDTFESAFAFAQKLGSISLSDTGLTDAGLLYLTRCPKLVAINVGGPSVTPDGIAKLSNAIPGKCSIVHIKPGAPK